MRSKIADKMTAHVVNPVLYAQKKFGSQEVETNEKGQMKYKCPVQIVDETGHLLSLDVIVWAEGNPFEGMKTLDPVVFTDCEISYGFFSRDGRPTKYWNILAKSVKRA